MANAQGAAARSASESDDLGRPGKGMTEAPDLMRISDPSPHSSASGSVSGGMPSVERCSKGPARGKGPSGRAGTAKPPQDLVSGAGGKAPGESQKSNPEKAKSGCWCF